MASISRVLFIVLLCYSALVVSKPRFMHHKEEGESEDRLERSKAARQRALLKLQQVFGVSTHESHTRPPVAPQFMVELYNTITDPRGVTHGKTPYNAKVVRSFVERDNSKPQLYFFNISGLGEDEKILEAELHLFRMREPLHSLPPTIFTSPNYLIRVYQVLDANRLDTPDVHRLLSVHYVSAHDFGWHVFNVKQAVMAWVSGSASNLGLIVTASTLFGDQVNVRFVRRNDHHHNKQPILVLFDDDTASPEPLSSTGYRNYVRYGNGDRVTPTHENEGDDEGDGRTKRSLYGDSPLQTVDTDVTSDDECARHDMYVNFTEIGWSSWILSPSGYWASHCRGRCDFPLGENQRPTNHATVQSIVHEMGLVENVGKPCCVPNHLASISLLYMDEQMNIIFKMYEDMVADSCGCH